MEDPTTTPPVVRYWVDNPTPIVFNGHTFEPLFMVWSNIKTSQAMNIDGCTVAVSNIGGIAATYINDIDITENEVTLELLHEDLLSQVTGHWLRKGEVMAIQGDDMILTITVGRQLGKNVLPRKVYLSSEFKGLVSDVPKIFS